jgi:dephospho-CoA kinase
MKKIGITGNQGSGKSFIVKEFSKLGVPTIMMDDVAKLVQTIYPDLIQKLQVRFPEGYPDGILDKSKMREILFFDKSGENLKDMAGLIKPYLHTEVERFYQTNSDQPFVIVESALLFEYNLQNNFDLIIFVHYDPQLRKHKALERDKITSEEYDNRMKNQLSDEFKMKNSDYTVINDFTQNVIDEVYRLYKILNNG